MQEKSIKESGVSESDYLSVREKLIRAFSAAACRMEKKMNEGNLSLLEYREYSLGIAMLRAIGYRTARTKWWFTSPIQDFLDEKSPDYEGQINTFKALRISRLGRFFRSALPMLRVTFRAHGIRMPATLEVLHSEFHRTEEGPFPQSAF